MSFIPIDTHGEGRRGSLPERGVPGGHLHTHPFVFKQMSDIDENEAGVEKREVVRIDKEIRKLVDTQHVDGWVLDRTLSKKRFLEYMGDLNRRLKLIQGVKIDETGRLRLDPGSEDEGTQMSQALQRMISTILLPQPLRLEVEQFNQEMSHHELLEWLHAEIEGDHPISTDSLSNGGSSQGE